MSGGDGYAAEHGLASRSSLMVDRITTVPQGKLGKPVGRLGDEDRIRLNRAMRVLLGLAR